MSQNEVQKIQRKWDKHFLMKIQSSTVRSEIKISVASRESQCKYWYISNKNDLTSKISVYQCVWSIPWLKYVKGTGLQNKVFEYLTFKSGNFGKMSRESQWNGWYNEKLLFLPIGLHGNTVIIWTANEDIGHIFHNLQLDDTKT